MFTVDWQMPVLTPFARVQAFDPDERPQLTYSMSKSDLFSMNSTSGIITLLKSLHNVNEERFDLEARVTDGLYEATAPVQVRRLGLGTASTTRFQIYRLAPGSSIVIAAVDSRVENIDQLQVERHISTALGLDFHILAKQVFIGEDEQADPTKSHLFVYAQDKKTRRPLDAEALKK